jgi:hypothetical protein
LRYAITNLDDLAEKHVYKECNASAHDELSSKIYENGEFIPFSDEKLTRRAKEIKPIRL